MASPDQEGHFPAVLSLISSSPFVIALACISAYYLLDTIYSVTLHPLAAVPGPRLCAISRIPYWIVHAQGKDVCWLHQLHLKYGPMVRYGPTDLSCTAGEAWKDINGHQKGKRELDVAAEMLMQPVNGVRSMNGATSEDHARVRRLFSPAFSDKALKKQEPLFRSYVQLLLFILSQSTRTQDSVEMTQLYNFTTFDTMAQLCFGHSLGMLQENKPSPWVQSVFDSLRMIPFATVIAYYPLLNVLFAYFEPKSITAQRKVHCQFSADRVDQRLQEGSEKPDVWNLVLLAQEAGNEVLSLKEMHSNAELFMLAGSETTATLLSGLTHLLLSNREYWDRLTTEIRTRYARAEDITFDNLSECRMLHACLKEALRMYPPVPIGVPRIIPEGGQAVLGRWIPQDTRVSVHQYATYHSPANFRDPDKFVPERWLGDPYYAHDAREAHQPFGYGPKNCIGQTMAMHEMKLILASVLLMFDFELCDPDEDWFNQRTFAMWIKNPLRCRVSAVGT